MSITPTSVLMAVKRTEEETVCPPCTIWPSMAIRDEAMPKSMTDACRLPGANLMPGDRKRTIDGEYERAVVVREEPELLMTRCPGHHAPRGRRLDKEGVDHGALAS